MLSTHLLIDPPQEYSMVYQKGRYQDAFDSLCRLRNTSLQAARDLCSVHAQIKEEDKIIGENFYATRFVELITTDYMDHITGRVQDTKRRLDIRQRDIRTLRQTSSILTALEGKCDARVQFEDPTVGERELARIERWMEEATYFTFAQELPA